MAEIIADPVSGSLQTAPPPNHEAQKAWQDIVQGIQDLYAEPLAEGEAEAAARNLITFYRTLLVIKKRAGQDRCHEQHR